MSIKQKKAAKRNIKKARKKWKTMPSKARAKAMPSRPYKVHTNLWHRLVAILRRKGTVRSPQAVATAKLGKKGFMKRKVKSSKGPWKRYKKTVSKKGYTRSGYTRKGFIRKHKRIKSSRVKKSRVKKGKTTITGWEK